MQARWWIWTRGSEKEVAGGDQERPDPAVALLRQPTMAAAVVVADELQMEAVAICRRSR